MLLKITDGQALDERKLMDVYAESNLENTDFFCPEEPDKEAAVRMVESGFLDFLKNEFFKEPDEVRKLAMAFVKEANELQKVAATGDVAAIKAQFGKTGETCKACHDKFRKDD